MGVELNQTILASKPHGTLSEKLRQRGIEICSLTGDEGVTDLYVLSERLAVERRTGVSLALGIRDKSLFASALTLRERFAFPVLLIEGSVDYEHARFHPRAILGAISSMVIQYGMSVVSTEGLDETAELISVMCRQEQIGIPEISLTPKRPAVDLPDLQRRVMEMLPGCGMVGARDLLQWFGSIQAIVGASREDLCRVPGIGRGRADDIHRVLHSDYEAVDTEKQLESAIEVESSLLFDCQAELVARQHQIVTGSGERIIVDLIFYLPSTHELILVELKRGSLTPEDSLQLGRYLDCVGDSPLLTTYLMRGARVRGILGSLETVGENAIQSNREDMRAAVIDKARTIDVLKELRARRLSEGA